jgi:hypothetical protein
VDKAEVIAVLRLALRALNSAPCFRVPGAENSYKVCSEIERVLRAMEVLP